MSEDVDLIQVARILKSNGTDGELLISFRDIAPEDIDTQEPVFIYCDGLPVPFFITAFAQRGRNRALVKFADVNSFDDAEEICGQAVYVNAEDYSDLDTSEEGDFSMLAGWPLEDADGGQTDTQSDDGSNPPADKTKQQPEIIELVSSHKITALVYGLIDTQLRMLHENIWCHRIRERLYNTRNN